MSERATVLYDIPGPKARRLNLILSVVFGIVLAALVWWIISVLIAVFGITCIWSIKELFEQEERVKKGWFPENPKKKQK